MDNFREFCETTTWHGWSHLVACKSYLGKFAWLVVIMLGLVLFLIQMVGMVRAYAVIGEHYSSSVKQIFDTSGLDYPIITVCNYNRIRKDKAEQYGFNQDLRKYFLSHTGSGYLLKDLDVNHIKEKYTKWRKEHNFNYEKIVRTMGHGCESTITMISNIHFKPTTDVCKSTIEKNRLIVEDIITPDHLLCHQIHVDKMLNISGTGSRFSVKLLLNAMTGQYTDESINNAVDEGLAIQLSTDGKVSQGDWLSVMPGMHTRIGLQTVKKHMKSLSPETKLFGLSPPCEVDPIMPIGQDKDFDVTNCYDNCLEATAAYACNCVPKIIGKNLRTCEIEEIDDCIEPFINKSKASGQFDKDVEECKNKYCAYSSCESSMFETQLETLRFPSRNQLEDIKQQLTARNITLESQSLKRFDIDMALVDIYYKSLGVQVVELFESVTLNQLIGNLGGLLGLFMGVSYLTIVHLIVTFCTCCTACKKKKVGDDNEMTGNHESKF